MAIFGNIFHKKVRQSKVSASDQIPPVFPTQEEDPEDEMADKDDTSEAFTKGSTSEETYEVLEREIHPAKIVCPDCGGITLEGLEFCDKCGGELQ